MKLELENSTILFEPDGPAIAAALASLDGESNGFAILSASDLVYIQAAINPEGSFMVEYQEGSIDQHYQSVGAVSPQQVVESFRLYAQNDPGWKLGCDWEKMKW